jgi:hypothetical protein
MEQDSRVALNKIARKIHFEPTIREEQVWRATVWAPGGFVFYGVDKSRRTAKKIACDQALPVFKDWCERNGHNWEGKHICP